ncbi:sugar kinase [Streptomyces albidoflavus]|nr:sugar kinase [Streptomyces albidoflavus]
MARRPGAWPACCGSHARPGRANGRSGPACRGRGVEHRVWTTLSNRGDNGSGPRDVLRGARDGRCLHRSSDRDPYRADRRAGHRRHQDRRCPRRPGGAHRPAGAAADPRGPGRRAGGGRRPRGARGTRRAPRLGAGRRARHRQRGTGRRLGRHGQPGQHPGLARLPAGRTGPGGGGRAAGAADRRRCRRRRRRALAGRGTRLRRRALHGRLHRRGRRTGPRRPPLRGPHRERRSHRPHQRRLRRRPLPVRRPGLRRTHRERPPHRRPRAGGGVAPGARR